MKNVKSLLLLLPLLLANKCTPPYEPPKSELCIHNNSNSAECADLRKPSEEQQYHNENLVNYICTNPDDYRQAYNYCMDLRQKLIECKSKVK